MHLAEEVVDGISGATVGAVRLGPHQALAENFKQRVIFCPAAWTKMANLETHLTIDPLGSNRVPYARNLWHAGSILQLHR